MKRGVAIISGYNQRAVIALLRTLEQNRIPFGVISSGSDDAIKFTKYHTKVLYTRNNKQLDINDLTNGLQTIKEKMSLDKVLIAPTTEGLNRFLLDNRQEFEEQDIEIPLVDKSTYENISDKYKFNALCKKNKITVPGEYNDIDNVVIPYVAKPKKYFSSDGQTASPILVLTEQEHNHLISQHDIKDFYFQEFVDGQSIYLLYYFYKNGSVIKLSQKNLMQQPGGKSIIASQVANYHKEEISKKYEALFRSIDYNGLVMVEIKKTRSNRYYMIEANPRFWGPSQLFIDAGRNLFNHFLYDTNFCIEKPVIGKLDLNAKYFWFGGLCQIAYRNQKVVYHRYTKNQFLNDFPKWVSADLYNRPDTKDLFGQEIYYL